MSFKAPCNPQALEALTRRLLHFDSQSNRDVTSWMEAASRVLLQDSWFSYTLSLSFCVFACLELQPDSRHGQGQGHDAGESTQSTADLTAFVQNLLLQMQSRFQTMSDSIISKNILFHYASGQLGFLLCLCFSC
ncbi:unnamed protein product [Sphagnum balticum]